MKPDVDPGTGTRVNVDSANPATGADRSGRADRYPTPARAATASGAWHRRRSPLHCCVPGNCDVRQRRPHRTRLIRPLRGAYRRRSDIGTHVDARPISPPTCWVVRWKPSTADRRYRPAARFGRGRPRSGISFLGRPRYAAGASLSGGARRRSRGGRRQHGRDGPEKRRGHYLECTVRAPHSSKHWSTVTPAKSGCPRMLGVFSARRFDQPGDAASQLLGGFDGAGRWPARGEASAITASVTTFVTQDFRRAITQQPRRHPGYRDASHSTTSTSTPAPMARAARAEIRDRRRARGRVNAVYHASGLRVRDLPVTFDKLLPQPLADSAARASLTPCSTRYHQARNAL